MNKQYCTIKYKLAKLVFFIKDININHKCLSKFQLKANKRHMQIKLFLREC